MDAAAHSNRAYFTSGEVVHEFDAESKNWTNMIKCPHVYFSMATMEKELLVVGGLVVTGESGDIKTFPATNKILSISLENNVEQNQWEEKYPAMTKDRVLPKVVVFGKYLIVLGGYQHDQDRKPTTSVEVLDTEKHCWYSNDEISMPEEFSTMQWLTACVCNKYLYIAARHDDPNFDRTISEMNDRRVNFVADDSDSDDSDDEDDYPTQAGPCYSFYRCSVEKLLQAAQKDSSDNPLARNQPVWQKLDHPHPTCYKNKKIYPVDEEERTWESDLLYYNVCKFTLSCVDDTLVAVGCSHIKSVSENEVQGVLFAYESYRTIKQNTRRENFAVITSDDAETVDTKCHIYMFNTENFTWKLVKSTESENGRSCDQPSVAVVGNDKLVIIRKSKTVQIITFS